MLILVFFLWILLLGIDSIRIVTDHKTSFLASCITIYWMEAVNRILRSTHFFDVGTSNLSMCIMHKAVEESVHLPTTAPGLPVGTLMILNYLSMSFALCCFSLSDVVDLVEEWLVGYATFLYIRGNILFSYEDCSLVSFLEFL